MVRDDNTEDYHNVTCWPSVLLPPYLMKALNHSTTSEIHGISPSPPPATVHDENENKEDCNSNEHPNKETPTPPTPPNNNNNHNHNPCPVRILSVGYHARMTKSASPMPTLSIKEQASRLRNELESAGVGDRPVIFVTHSMGGLIVKEMLVEDSKDVYSPLLHQTKGVVFYSTPHRGSPVVNQFAMLKVVFGWTPLVRKMTEK